MELNTKILDCHTHMGPYFNFNICDNDVNALIDVMNITNVSACAISAHLGISADFIEGNNLVMEAAQHYPDRFYIYACVNPHYPNQIIDELERCFMHKNTIGIKTHCDIHQCAIDSGKYTKVYEFAQEHECIVLMHTWGTASIEQVKNVVQRYNKAKFIIGHAGAEIIAMRMAIQLSKRYSNVYLDTALSRAYEGNIEWLVSEAGAEKILFGSDMPFYDSRITLGRILLSKLSEGDKMRILGRNFEQLLQRN